MVKRRVSLGYYLKVGFLTLLIFFLGLCLGIIIDNERISWLLTESRDQEVRYQSLQLQYLYLNTLEDNEKSCPVLEKSLENSIADLGKTLDTLEKYQKSTPMNQDEYARIHHQYVLDNLRYWLFVNRMKTVCNKDLVTVLYFYSTDNCPICPDQGVILTYFKKIFKDRLLIFPINVDLVKDEPMISIIESKYLINKYPSLVVDEVKYEEVVPKENLSRIICGSFTTRQPECEAG
jgi:hypothetical protein